MSVFAIFVEYTAPEDEVAPVRAVHREFLHEQARAGHFLLWGRREPATGGLIIAQGDDRETVERLAAADPFVTGGVAKSEVVEFGYFDCAEELRPLLR